MNAQQITSQPSHRVLRDEELWDQLTRVRDARNAQDGVLWNMFSTFWASNAVLLVALFSTGKPPESPVVGIVVSTVGTALSLAWYGIQARVLGHIVRFEELTREIERRLNLEPEITLNAGGFINKKSPELSAASFFEKSPSARRIMERCSQGTAVLWALAFLAFVVSALVGAAK